MLGPTFRAGLVLWLKRKGHFQERVGTAPCSINSGRSTRTLTLVFCKLPAVTCGLIAGTRGVTVQVRDLVPTPRRAWLDFSAKPTRSQSLLTPRPRGSEGTRTRLPVPSGVGSSGISTPTPAQFPRVGIELSPPCNAALQLDDPPYTLLRAGRPLYQDRIFRGGKCSRVRSRGRHF